MDGRTRIGLGVREDLGADCAGCFGLCCVALAFARSADFPIDKAPGDPCRHLDDADGCRIHGDLRGHGFKGCTVFDCFGAGQKVSQHTFGGRSWRADPATGAEMFRVFPLVRRLHELLWYLDRALALTPDGDLAAALSERFARIKRLSDGSSEELAGLDVDAEYDAARPLLLEASELARSSVRVAAAARGLGPGADLSGASLAAADLRGVCLRGSLMIGTDLSSALLGRCDLLGVDLRDADLAGADLQDAIYLTQMQVSSARGDASTLLPDGFDRPGHWSA